MMPSSFSSQLLGGLQGWAIAQSYDVTCICNVRLGLDFAVLVYKLDNQTSRMLRSRSKDLNNRANVSAVQPRFGSVDQERNHIVFMDVHLSFYSSRQRREIQQPRATPWVTDR